MSVLAPRNMLMSDLRAKLPKVDALLAPELVERFGHARVVRHARAVIETGRARAAQGDLPTLASLIQSLSDRLDDGVRPVINATGVLLHTNMGRAPWGTGAVEKAAMAAGFCDVELDLKAGKRGGRGRGVEDRLCALTSAPAALVVNNCAGAVLLMLAALAKDQEVLVSRGELVEIGGGFRVPDVMAASGAILREVGTTNRTHLRDFEAAISPEVAGVLRVHHSNFKQVGFVTQPSLKELGALDSPLLVDLGSGQLEWSQLEPSVHEALAAQAAVICMSGDKLLGGPQAGILLGQCTYIERIRSHPLYRALRPDKVILAALEGTLDDWLRGRMSPFTAMRAVSNDSLREAVDGWVKELEGVADVRVIDTEATVGGGSLPGQSIPSVGVSISGLDVEALARQLRLGHPPVIGRIERDALILDTRSVIPLGNGPALLTAIKKALRLLTSQN